MHYFREGILRRKSPTYVGYGKTQVPLGKLAARRARTQSSMRPRSRAAGQSLTGAVLPIPSSPRCSRFLGEISHSIPLRKQRGNSLIEVLISMLILGFGLLGVAGLQTSALRVNRDAWLVTQATLLSRQLIDDTRTRGGSLSDQVLVDWQVLLGRALPNGQGTAELENGRITVSVTWLAAHYETVDADRYQTLQLGSGL